MTLVGRHLDRGLEVAVQLLELTVGGETVPLDHVLGLAEGDAQGLVLAPLDDGDRVAITGQGPLRLIDRVPVEVVGESDLLADRGIDSQGARGQEEEEGSHGILKTLTQSTCIGSGPSLGFMKSLSRPPSGNHWVNSMNIGSLGMGRDSLCTWRPSTYQM